MKIGVMTFWWSEDNYGQILQCYALQKYLRDQGHDAYLIRYDPRNDYTPTPLPIKLLKALNPVKLYSFIHRKVNQKKIIREHKEHPRKFSEFRDQYIKQSHKIYYSWQELRDDPPEADMYIVGSDQVWNFSQATLQSCRNILHAYFLDFGAVSIKRVAYAASWGKISISEEFITEIVLLLAKFNHVSVREKHGLDLCKQCNKQAALTVDPVFLINESQYLFLFSEKNEALPQKKYLFVYFLGNQKYIPIDHCFTWAKQHSLELVYVTGNGQHDPYPKIYPSISEWLALIYNAHYVITNSFHCSVFSLLFKKQFGIYKLDGVNSGMNDRFDTLFKQTGIPERYISKNDFSILDIPYCAQMPDNSFIEDIIYENSININNSSHI